MNSNSLISNYRKSVENVMNFIFGERLFKDLYDFFINVFSLFNPEVIILTTRRSHLLYCLFSNYIFTNADIVKYNMKEVLIITDKAIDFYKEKIDDSQVVVIDDILIHGRALEDVFKRVSLVNPKNVKKAVFAIDKNTKYTVDYCCYTLEKKLWKELSNKIVSSLILSSTPYASYLYSFFAFISEEEFTGLVNNLLNEVDGDVFDKKYTTLDLSLNESDNENIINKELKKHILGYIIPLNNDLNCNEFLRVYYNKYTKLCITIPSKILGSYSGSEIDCEFKKIFSANNELNKFQSYKYEIKYRMLTTYYSISLLEKHKSKIPSILIEDNSFSDINKLNIDMSYFTGFYDEIKKLKFVHSNNVATGFLDDNSIKEYVVYNKYSNTELVPDVYLNSFKKTINTNNCNILSFNDEKNPSIFTGLLYNFLRLVDIEEEFIIDKSFNKDESLNATTDILNKLNHLKQKGLSFSFIDILAKRKKVSLFEIYSKIINGADTGLITFYADTYNLGKEKIYSNFLIKGEQVCRLYQNKYLITVLYLKQFYDYVQAHFELEMNFIEFIENCISNINNIDNRIMLIANYINNVDSFIPKLLIENIYEEVNDKYLELLIEKGYKHLE